MKYFRCSGIVTTDREFEYVLFAAQNKEDAQRQFESYVERFIEIYDLEIEEDLDPDEIAVNE